MFTACIGLRSSAPRAGRSTPALRAPGPIVSPGLLQLLSHCGFVSTTTGPRTTHGQPGSRDYAVKREILISGSPRETRVAILEDDRLVELLVYRPDAHRMVGD